MPAHLRMMRETTSPGNETMENPDQAVTINPTVGEGGDRSENGHANPEINRDKGGGNISLVAQQRASRLRSLCLTHGVAYGEGCEDRLAEAGVSTGSATHHQPPGAPGSAPSNGVGIDLLPPAAPGVAPSNGRPRGARTWLLAGLALAAAVVGGRATAPVEIRTVTESRSVQVEDPQLRSWVQAMWSDLVADKIIQFDVDTGVPRKLTRQEIEGRWSDMDSQAANAAMGILDTPTLIPPQRVSAKTTSKKTR